MTAEASGGSTIAATPYEAQVRRPKIAVLQNLPALA